MSKCIRDIFGECTDEQAVRWLEDIREDRWPRDMPIPAEAFSDVWYQLQKRVIDIKPKPREEPK
jgi:hypothetical protein